MPRTKGKIPKRCIQCGDPFTVFPYDVKKGFDKYCSLKCSSESKKGKPAKYDVNKMHPRARLGTGMSPEELAEKKRVYQAKYRERDGVAERIRQWHVANSTRIKEIKRKYARTEKGLITAKRRAHKRLAKIKELNATLNVEYWVWLCKYLDYKCQMCHQQFTLSTLTVDHMLPINKGGDNEEWNIQPLCNSCNCRKQDRLIGIDNAGPLEGFLHWFVGKIRQGVVT